MHFDARHSQLLLSCEYVFAPSNSPVEVLHEILDMFLLRKAHIVYMDGGAGFSLCG
jgi:hypothetical protein